MDSALQQQVTRAVYDSEWGIKATGVRVSKQAIRILETASCWLKDQGAEMAIFDVRAAARNWEKERHA